MNLKISFRSDTGGGEHIPRVLFIHILVKVTGEWINIRWPANQSDSTRIKLRFTFTALCTLVFPPASLLNCLRVSIYSKYDVWRGEDSTSRVFIVALCHFSFYYGVAYFSIQKVKKMHFHPILLICPPRHVNPNFKLFCRNVSFVCAQRIQFKFQTGRNKKKESISNEKQIK